MVSVDVKHHVYLLTYVGARTSAVSLLESGELRYIKAINHNNTSLLQKIDDAVCHSMALSPMVIMSQAPQLFRISET